MLDETNGPHGHRLDGQGMALTLDSAPAEAEDEGGTEIQIGRPAEDSAPIYAAYAPAAVDLGAVFDAAPATAATVDAPEMAMDRHPVIEDNNAFLMAMGEGSRIEIHAADAAKTSWTQLDGTAAAGATSITLAEAHGWEVGDQIVIASTDFDLNQAETRTIAAVSADGRTVSFDDPLAYMHYGEVETYDDGTDLHRLDMRAEVGLLTRNVTIQGDADAAQDKYGGHTMVMMGAEMYISGAEFTRMGQVGELGRYATHWHLVGDATGQYISNSSYHHTYNKGMTIHGTDNATVSDNVIFETIGHTYFFEDGTETGNVLDGNLGINTRAASEDEATISSDRKSASTFWVENGDNHLIDNHAAGSEDHGFWYEVTRDHERDMGVISGNTAHSNEGRGFFLNHAGLIQDGSPRGSAEQPQKVDPWVVDGMTVYKSELGAYVRGVEGTFTNAAFAEMGNNARFRLNQTFEDSLIVGATGNVGTPETAEEVAAGRSLPDSGELRGFQFYDGPASLKNVHFDGFEGDNPAIYLSNAIHKTTAFGFEGVTFGDNVDEAQKLSIDGGGRSISNDSWARGFVDVDGSITGTAGAVVRQLDGRGNLFNAGADHEVREDWGAVISYGTTPGTLTIDDRGTPEDNDGKNAGWSARNTSVTRSDGVSASDLREQIPVFTDGSFTYELDFDGGADQFRLYLHDTGWGESVIFNLGPVPDTSSFTVDDPYSDAARPAREVSSMAMLEASPDTAVFRAPSGEVHIKLVAEMAHGYLWPQPGVAYQDKLNSGVTVLVDTAAGLDPQALPFDDPAPGATLGPPPLPPEADPVPGRQDVPDHLSAPREAGVDADGLPRWSDPAVWGGALPDRDDVVVIDAGTQLVLDTSATVRGIIVQGEGSALIVEDAVGERIDLTADWVLVNDGALFQAGTEADPLDTDFTLTLTGDDPDFDLDVGAHLSGAAPDTVVAQTPATMVAQSGTATVDAAHDGDWHRIDFDAPMDDPVVVASLASRNGGHAAVLRVRNVTSDGFDVLLEEWEHNAGWHAAESVSWLAVETGLHLLPGGAVIEAGVASVTDQATEVALTGDFGAEAPVVLGQVASDTEMDTVTERIFDVDGGGFSVRLDEEEALRRGGHAAEDLHYVAVSQGGHAGLTTGRFDTAAGGPSQGPAGWGAGLAPGVPVIADLQTSAGRDTAAVRYDDGAGVWRVEEERSADNEIHHQSEAVGWVALDGALLV